MGAGIPAPLSPQGVGLGEEESRELERRRQFGAAMVVGARTMMEGGALGSYTRQQVEMFCQKNLIGMCSSMNASSRGVKRIAWLSSVTEIVIF